MKALIGLEKFSGGGWVVHKVIIVSVRVLCVSLHRLKSFPVGGGGWVIHKVIIVSVRVLYVGFFGQDRTPGFSDRTGRDAELDNSSFLDVSLSD